MGVFSVFLVCFLWVIINLIIFLVWKGIIGVFGGMSKNVWGLWVCFLCVIINLESFKWKFCLLHTTDNPKQIPKGHYVQVLHAKIV